MKAVLFTNAKLKGKYLFQYIEAVDVNSSKIKNVYKKELYQIFILIQLFFLIILMNISF